jgi:hypothetical protein
MAGYFSDEALATLKRGREDMRRQFRDLQSKFLGRKYRSARGLEYASQGFCRRLETLVEAVNWVFELLPPEQDEIPERDNVVLAAMFIQSFVFNAFGCLENLAWIWVFESGLKGPNGRELQVQQVGLGPRYGYVRRSFSPEFCDFLKSRRKWFKHITEFRDSLAHRIPLYIPPYIISDENMKEYQRLEGELSQAMGRGDHETFDRLREEQKKLGLFRPWMTHSPTEGSPAAVFHYQLLQDYVTIDEFGRTMLEELDRLQNGFKVDWKAVALWYLQKQWRWLVKLASWLRS